MKTKFKTHLTEAIPAWQIFAEDSARNKIVFEYMEQIGYNFLGAGSFKAAFINSKTHKVKIVLFDESSSEQANLRKWVSFCNKHSANPHLPQISFAKPLLIQGEKFIVADAERLFEISSSEIREIRWAISDIVDACKKANLATSTFKEGARTYILADAKARLEADKDFGESMALLVLSVEDFNLMLETILDIIDALPNNAFLDLHAGNIMLASDGTIVFTDPWAT